MNFKIWLSFLCLAACTAAAWLTLAFAAEKKPAAAGVTSAPIAEKGTVPGATPAAPAKKADPQPASPAEKPAKAPDNAVMPDTGKMTLLIQSFMVALAQANITGNYAVLHAFGSPDFQSRNSPAQLAQSFAALRQKVDMSQIILYPPTLTNFPQMGPNGILQVSGVYKIPPQPLQFSIGMQSVAGMWRLAAINVSNIVQSQAEAGQRPTLPTANAQAVPAAKTPSDGNRK